MYMYKSERQCKECSCFEYYFVGSLPEVDVILDDGMWRDAAQRLRDMLGLVCDQAHVRCEKLLTARAKVA